MVTLGPALAVLAWSVLGASPSHYWLDSGELAAAGAGLGVPHPPGAPGLTMLLHLAAGLPIGTLGFRMSVACGALGGLSVALLADRLRARGASEWAIYAFVAWVLATTSFARHARVVEIYTLATALTAVAVWALDPARTAEERERTAPIGVAAVVVAAWGWGDLRIALLPAVGVGWWLALRRREAWAAPPVFMATVVAASSCVLVLPLSSLHGPVADWGDPQTWSRFVDHISATSIRVAFADKILPRDPTMLFAHAQTLLRVLARDLGPVGPIAIVAAIALSIAANDARPEQAPHSRARADASPPGGAHGVARACAPAQARALGLVGAWLVCAQVGYAIAINPMGTPDRQTTTILAVFGPFFVVAELSRRVGGHGGVQLVAAALIAALGVAPALSGSWFDAVQTRSWAPHRLATLALESAPPRALVLTQSDDLSAGSMALRTMEGARPDLTHAVAQHLHKPPPDEVAARRASSLAQAVWASAAAAEGERARIVAAVYAARDQRRAIALESPGRGVLREVAVRSSRGGLPLTIVWPQGAGGWSPDFDHVSRPTSSDGNRGPEEPAADRARRFVARARVDAVSPADLRKMASVLVDLADATIAARPGDPVAVVDAEAVLWLALEEIDATDPAALVSLGAVHDRLGRRESAIHLTERALAREPDRPAALRNLALYYARLPGRQEEARALVRRARAVDPGAASDQRARDVCRLLGDPGCDSSTMPP